MNLKLLSVAVAIGGALICHQGNAPVSVDCNSDFPGPMATGSVIKVDRSDLSHQLLPAHWDHLGDGFDDVTANEPAANLNAGLPAVRSRFETADSPTDAPVNDLGSTESKPELDSFAVATDSVAGPHRRSAYQQKVADQRAWRSLARPVQLSSFPASSAPFALSGPPIAQPAPWSLSRNGDDTPIVPGMTDPHHWYQKQQQADAKPMPLLAPQLVSQSDQGVMPLDPVVSDSPAQISVGLSAGKPNDRRQLAQAIAAAEAKWQTEPNPSVRPQEKSVLSPPENRVARAWETGRY